MGLKEYNDKRNFSKSPEPIGEEQKLSNFDKHKFVIQKHDATHLHYDFRLEIEGVLKSWAIPKGPSLNNSDKRLAMMVEDHPIEYGAFEGIIPKGNYGAGAVIIWDEGTFYAPGVSGKEANEHELKKMLYQGNIKLVMEGSKIKGEFALVKAKRKNGKGNEWLLIKKEDEFSNINDILKNDRSVKSNKTIEEIYQSGEDVNKWYSPKKKNLGLENFPTVTQPEFIKPTLASLVKEPFRNKDWFFEIKWDGFRCISTLKNNMVNLFSRNNLSFNKDFPEVLQAVQKLGVNVILDGEIVVLNEKGISSFQLIQNYKRTGVGTLAYYIFDILFLDGHDLTQLPLIKRKELLRQIIPENDPILKFSDHITEDGISLFDVAMQSQVEGIIAKKAQSIYQPGKRVADWLKIKILKSQEAVIVGFTEPRGSRKKLGSLVLGVYDNKELIYIGNSGGGFDKKMIDEIFDLLKPIEINKSKMVNPPKTDMPVHWVEPKYVCQVKFQEWTDEGIMRQPIFLGLRSDKNPKDVTREQMLVGKSKVSESAMRPPVSKKSNKVASKKKAKIEPKKK